MPFMKAVPSVLSIRIMSAAKEMIRPIAIPKVNDTFKPPEKRESRAATMTTKVVRGWKIAAIASSFRLRASMSRTMDAKKNGIVISAIICLLLFNVARK